MPSAKWRYKESCHLFSDNEDELLDFARIMGLRAGWIQKKPNSLIHFDLTASKRKQAVGMGAEEVSDKFMVAKIKEQRGW